jgi:transposase-like protein
MSDGKGTMAMFAGRHFDPEVILLCVRWYLRYKLSLRDLVEMMAERGLELAHTTIMRWVQRYVPEFEKSWARYARKVSRSWRVDETYLKVCGRWVYLYRAVDKEGNTVDFRLNPKRDVAAVKAFFHKALCPKGVLPPASLWMAMPHRIEQCARCRAKNEVWKHTKMRSLKYLNNLVEQDHRGINREPDPCSDSTASTMLPSPLPESNYYVVFIKANSPSGHVSKTKLRPLSGMPYSLRRSQTLRN